MVKFLKLVSSIAVCLLAGGLGTIFTVSAIPTWYTTLNKPFFSPPNWIFAPVWTTLYVLMGISFYLIWVKGFKTKKVRDAVSIFAIQLILNTIWSPVFFGYKNIFLALIIIVAMWIFILKTIKAFAKINKLASYLLYPYLAWVSFATVLNFSVWVLNK
ncbi:MAG TPA: TspO/MBR family protein [Alphaproteobacteria bacterium]|jgi:tryptophan-rich sensory protein|nr:TspO/MBR family protein [Alphaproteobacteria bacterium]